jgi:uncharacterized protein (DUF4415 family)
MTENKRSMVQGWNDQDDAPDLSTADWQKKIATAPVKRGRPKLELTKVSTTIRLDQDIIAAFRNQGPNWQSRINDALRAWLKQL